jgi:YHS domain-containing protein
MKTTIITAAITSLFLVSCKPAKTEATQATTPVEKCIVSGEALGEMGAPFEYVYQGKTLKFCCKSCVPKFEKDPAKYLAKSDAAPDAK